MERDTLLRVRLTPKGEEVHPFFVKTCSGSTKSINIQSSNISVLFPINIPDPSGSLTVHSFLYELFTSIEVSLQHQLVVKVCQHGVLQSNLGFLLQRLESLRVVVLTKML